MDAIDNIIRLARDGNRDTAQDIPSDILTLQDEMIKSANHRKRSMHWREHWQRSYHAIVPPLSPTRARP